MFNRKILYTLLFFLFFSEYSFAFDQMTHQSINELVFEKTNIINYLDELKIDELQKNILKESLMKGGFNEDVPLTRSMNHFHEPFP